MSVYSIWEKNQPFNLILVLAYHFTIFFQFHIVDCTFEDCHSECNTEGVFTKDHGNISTPDFPSTLQPFSRCVWTIILPLNTFIELKFANFSIGKRQNQQCFEKVYVTMDTIGGVPVTWEYCDFVHPLVISATSSMTLEYITDLEPGSLGFQAQYTATGTDKSIRILSI